MGLTNLQRALRDAEPTLAERNCFDLAHQRLTADATSAKNEEEAATRALPEVLAREKLGEATVEDAAGARKRLQAATMNREGFAGAITELRRRRAKIDEQVIVLKQSLVLVLRHEARDLQRRAQEFIERELSELRQPLERLTTRDENGLPLGPAILAQVPLLHHLASAIQGAHLHVTPVVSVELPDGSRVPVDHPLALAEEEKAIAKAREADRDSGFLARAAERLGYGG